MFLAQKLMSNALAKTYATWNPSDKSVECALTNGNLRAAFTTGVATGVYGCRATIGKSTGKWYWEVKYVSATVVGFLVGIGTNGTTVNSYPGGSATSYGYYHNNGDKYNNGGHVGYGATWTTGDVIGIALDMDAGTLTFYKNGVSQGVAYSGITGTFYPFIGESNVSATTVADANFGASAFTYAVPSGYNAGVY